MKNTTMKLFEEYPDIAWKNVLSIAHANLYHSISSLLILKSYQLSKDAANNIRQPFCDMGGRELGAFTEVSLFTGWRAFSEAVTGSSSRESFVGFGNSFLPLQGRVRRVLTRTQSYRDHTITPPVNINNINPPLATSAMPTRWCARARAIQ